MKLKLMEELDSASLVTSTMDFQVGYFSGKQRKNIWLIKGRGLNKCMKR